MASPDRVGGPGINTNTRAPNLDNGLEKKICANPKNNNTKICTVLFVEQTREGKLMKAMKEVEMRLSGMLMFRTKIVERGGTSLKDLLPNKNPFGEAKCGRVALLPAHKG